MPCFLISYYIVEKMDVLKEYIWVIGEQLKRVSYLEGVGVFFGVLEVLFAKFNKVWLYPCGLISIVITTFLFFQSRLYAETLLQVYYFTMSVYGWILWSKKGTKELNVSYSTSGEKKISIGIAFVFWGVLYLILRHFTDSDVPAWDSFVTAFAWAGMWLLARRKIENWIFLNISNFAAIPLLIHKGLALYSLLTVFLFIVAVFGYFGWKKLIKPEIELTKIN